MIVVPIRVQIILILLACCAALACSKKEAPAEPVPETPAPDSAAAADTATPTADAPNGASPEAAPEPQPTVTVTSPGAEPRHVVRWKFQKDAEAKLSIAMNVTVQMTVDDEAQPATTTPPINTILSLAVKELGPDGDALVGFTVTEASMTKTDELSDDMAAKVNAALATMVGMEGSYRCAARGFVSDVVAEAPADAPAAVRQTVENIRQSIRQMMAPLPETAIGKGAEWTVDAAYQYSGMQVTETALYKATQVKPPKLAASVTVDQKAPPQTIVGANGQTGELESLTTTSKGANRWNLQSLSALAAQRDTQMEMIMKGASADGTDHRIVMSIDFGVEMKKR
ncbi:MAG: hypothetical protein WBG86_00855 [Polyangiales bacterium]